MMRFLPSIFFLFPLKFYPGGGGDGEWAARAETQGQEKNGIKMHNVKYTKKE